MSYELAIKSVTCDAPECDKTLKLNGQPGRATLPPPWRNVHVHGVIGPFQACSEECEEQLRVYHGAGRRDGQ